MIKSYKFDGATSFSLSTTFSSILSSPRHVGSAKLISLTLDLEPQLVPSLRPFSAAFRILMRSRLPKMDNKDGVPAVVQMKLRVGFKGATSRNSAAKQNRISLNQTVC